MTKNFNIDSIEEFAKSVNEKTEYSKLYQMILSDSAEFPQGILVRNLNNQQALSDKRFKSFLSLSTEILKEESFPFLYKDTAINLRPHGGGYMIPVPKSFDINKIILSLRELNLKKDLKLRFDISKDGPCEDGRNTRTEWKLLPPSFTMENANEHFSGFGIVKLVEKQREGFAVTFSQLFDTLPLSNLINPKNFGSNWFPVFKGRSTICRFTSSLSCSKCQMKGHHNSRCPPGLSEKVLQYRSLLKAKFSSVKTEHTQNHKNTKSVKATLVKSVSANQKDDMFVEGENIDTVISSNKKKKKTNSKRTISPDKNSLPVTLPTNTISKDFQKKNSKDLNSAKKTKKIVSRTSEKQPNLFSRLTEISNDPEFKLFSDNFDFDAMKDENEQENPSKNSGNKNIFDRN